MARTMTDVALMNSALMPLNNRHLLPPLALTPVGMWWVRAWHSTDSLNGILTDNCL